jgi:hypothetical protein
MTDALDLVEGWIASLNVFVPKPAGGHINRVANLIRQINGNHELTSDPYLAALAIEHRAVMCTHYCDFANFNGLSIFEEFGQFRPGPSREELNRMLNLPL